VSAVVVADALGVGDDFVREEAGQGHRETVPHAAETVPLAAVAFQAIDVQRHARAGQARQRREQRVGRVAEERDIVAPAHGVHGRAEGVLQGFEIFVAHGGQVLQVDAAPGADTGALAAIDGHIVTARHQARGELFGEGLKAAVVRGDAARTKNCNAHQSAIRARLILRRPGRRWRP
jgi:hypothetical protein